MMDEDKKKMPKRFDNTEANREAWQKGFEKGSLDGANQKDVNIQNLAAAYTNGYMAGYNSARTKK